MDEIDEKMADEIPAARRRELDEYAVHKGTKLTRQELRDWGKDFVIGKSGDRKATKYERRAQDECQSEYFRIEHNEPTTLLEILYVERFKLRLQEEKTQQLADKAEYLSQNVEVMMTIREAALFCNCNERTIRNRLLKKNGNGTPLIAGKNGYGRFTRIPRSSLLPYRKRPSETRNAPRKRRGRKTVKKSGKVQS